MLGLVTPITGRWARLSPGAGGRGHCKSRHGLELGSRVATPAEQLQEAQPTPGTCPARLPPPAPPPDQGGQRARGGGRGGSRHAPPLQRVGPRGLGRGTAPPRSSVSPFEVGDRNPGCRHFAQRSGRVRARAPLWRAGEDTATSGCEAAPTANPPVWVLGPAAQGWAFGTGRPGG